MKKALKIIGIIFASFVVLICVCLAVAYNVSGGKLNRKYAEPAPAQITVSADSATIARGMHIVNAVGSCQDCHGPDLGGKVVMDAGPMGIVVASNLTSGTGGIGSQMTDQDWVKAIRHGLRRDNTTLILMPSEAYTHMNDADLGALVSYLKQLPPVNRENPTTKLRVIGRTLLALDKLPMLSAELVAAQNVDRAAVTPGVTAEYGKYLANSSGCTGCHLPDLTGGVVFDPAMPASANITPTGIGSWTEADFMRALREGKRPNGTTITDAMPWKSLGKMTDDELRAVWMFLQTVPAKATATPGQ